MFLPRERGTIVFLRINDHLINVASIARASLDRAADGEAEGTAPDPDLGLTIAFVGNHPAPMSFRGDEARRLWAELKGHVQPQAALETK